MRCRLAIVALLSLPSWGQQRPCGTDTRYVAEKIKDLRWGLQGVSKLPEVEPSILAKLADNSVTALSNIHSLRSQYLRNCDKAPAEDFSALDANETFIAIFLRTIVATQFRKGDERSAAEVGWLLPGLSVQQDFKFHEVIQGEISRRMESSRDHSGAVWVACYELERATGPSEIKEIEIRPTPIVGVQTRNPLAKPFGEILPVLKKLTLHEALVDLAGYYQGHE